MTCEISSISWIDKIKAAKKCGKFTLADQSDSFRFSKMPFIENPNFDNSLDKDVSSLALYFHTEFNHAVLEHDFKHALEIYHSILELSYNDLHHRYN